MSQPDQTLISVSAARSIIRDAIDPLEAETVELGLAVGRTLAGPIVSSENIPPFDNSAMDGYAIRHEDLRPQPALLTVIGEIPCGVKPEQTISRGECMRIMTGAQIPDGADTVIQQEFVSKAGGQIAIDKDVPRAANIRRTGSNIRSGQEVVPAGAMVTPGTIAILATLGFHEVEVGRVPRVAVFSSGDELVSVEETPGPAQIRNSNGPTLAAQVVASGGVVVTVGVLRDNLDSISHLVDEVMTGDSPDALVISGGASVGDYDLVRQQLETMGMTVPFWKVRQRPGKPLAFGLLAGIPVFMLPGNPVSASICFEQYVRPSIRQMLNAKTIGPELVPAVFDGTIKKHKDLYYFARGVATVDDSAVLRVLPAGAQGSHVSQSLADANCIIHLPDGDEAPNPGDTVNIEWLKW